MLVRYCLKQAASLSWSLAQDQHMTSEGPAQTSSHALKHTYNVLVGIV